MLCEIAGVSKSGYYKWITKQKAPSSKYEEDLIIMEKIIKCEEDPDKNWSFGYFRVTTWLRKFYNLQVNHKRIYRLMKKLGIQAKIRKKTWKHFGRKEAYLRSDNHLNREFYASSPNEKWVTDITYLIFNGQR